MTDKQLLKMVTSFRRGILGKRPPNSMCYAICVPLCGYLSFIGVKSEMTEFVLEVDPECSEFPNEEYHHWVLKLYDGRIIDPTASQFNWFIKGQETEMPTVYLGEIPKWYKPANPHSPQVD